MTTERRIEPASALFVLRHRARLVLVLMVGFTLSHDPCEKPPGIATRGILNTSVAPSGTARREKPDYSDEN